MKGGRALEVGCGRGVGVEIILERFGADRVDAFDLDPRMVARARRRLARYGHRVEIWVGDATSVPLPDAHYDAVFDFGIIHHVPHWRAALAEIRRVLKPGGTFYAEEVMARFIQHPLTRRVLEHPQADRFDREQFRAGLVDAGLEPDDSREWIGAFAWFVAHRPATA
jgi:ubiquinone/menaquinone biosynthesis C-methylase UbiE